MHWGGKILVERWTVKSPGADRGFLLSLDGITIYNLWKVDIANCEKESYNRERSIHPCIHLQGWMFVWPVDPVRGRHGNNGLRMAYWEWYTFAISVANVSKGAAIVTSRSRSLLLSGQTSDSDRESDRVRGSDQWFTIFRDGTQMSVALISQA